MPLRSLADGDARIDVAIVIGAADDDLRGLLVGGVEEGADAVGRRGDLFDDLLQLLDGLAGLAHGLLLGGEEGAEIEQLLADGIAGSEGGDGAIQRLEGAEALIARRKVVSDHALQV